MLDAEGYVAEANGVNVFCIRQGTVLTPYADYCLPGITRATIIGISKELGIKVVEKDIVVDELYNADQAFFCGTASEISQIKSINGEAFSGNWEDSASYNIHFIYQQKVRFDEFEDLTIV